MQQLRFIKFKWIWNDEILAVRSAKGRTHFGSLSNVLFPSLMLAELGGLLKYVRPFLNSISKAKAARLVRSLLDLFLDMEAATGQEVELCLECIEWAKVEKRTFLRQALEVRPLREHNLLSQFLLRLLWRGFDNGLEFQNTTHN